MLNFDRILLIAWDVCKKMKSYDPFSKYINKEN